MPYYYTDDVDRADSCIGNMITLVDENNHDNSVTFQIYAHKYYKSFAEMIKSEVFGIEKKKTSASAAKLKEFFKDVTTEDEALALYVVKVNNEE